MTEKIESIDRDMEVESFQAHGYECVVWFMAQRTCGVPFPATVEGHFDGYVVLPPRHPWRRHGVWPRTKVHGGVDALFMCSLRGRAGQTALGFDCGHISDEPPNTKDLAWVRDECRRLAAQAEYAQRWYVRLGRWVERKWRA